MTESAIIRGDWFQLRVGEFRAGLKIALAYRFESQRNELIDILAGIREPAHGRFLFAFADPARAIRRGLVERTGGLVSNLSFWENTLICNGLNEGLKLPALEKTLRTLLADEELGFPEIDRVLHTLPAFLTVYQRRVAAMCRMILAAPDVCIYEDLVDHVKGIESAFLIDRALRFHEKQPERISLFVCDVDQLPHLVGTMDEVYHLQEPTKVLATV